MSKRDVSEHIKKEVATSQYFKCKNEPGSNVNRLEQFDCPLWKKDNDTKGLFDEQGWEIDHNDEVCVTGDNSIKNLQALCIPCHRMKTLLFNIDKTEKGSELENKFIAGKQYFKCANNNLLNYKCPLWQKNDNKGIFNNFSFHVIDSKAYCQLCYSVITNNNSGNKSVLNNLTIKKLQQLCMILNISRYGLKAEIINNVLCTSTPDDISDIISEIKNKKYFVRYKANNLKYCHQYHTNKNLKKIFVNSKCKGSRYDNVCCPTCNQKGSVYIYNNEFYNI